MSEHLKLHAYDNESDKPIKTIQFNKLLCQWLIQGCAGPMKFTNDKPGVLSNCDLPWGTIKNNGSASSFFHDVQLNRVILSNWYDLDTIHDNSKSKTAETCISNFS